MVRSSPRAWRPLLSSRGRVGRWVTFVMVAWLSLVLAGREHALQALGVHVACIHPGSSGQASTRDRSSEPLEAHGGRTAADTPPAPAGSHEVSVSTSDAGDGDDCPPNCTDCACGAAPFVPATPLVIAARSFSMHPFASGSPGDGPSRRVATLERPPRRG